MTNEVELCLSYQEWEGVLVVSAYKDEQGWIDGEEIGFHHEDGQFEEFGFPDQRGFNCEIHGTVPHELFIRYLNATNELVRLQVEIEQTIAKNRVIG